MIGLYTFAALMLFMQWLHYPTPGVPKSPDGSPNLQAPTPRAPDGKPDLSGTWAPENNNPCPPEGCRDMEVPQEFFNIAWGLHRDLPFQPGAAAEKKKRMEDNNKDDPVSRCLPGGIVKLHTTPLLKKFIQIPGLLVTLNEMDATYRQIFMDGRPLPDVDLPTAKGYSVGKWDGDTLVVTTRGFTAGLWLDRQGTPMSDAATITERFTRPNYGNMYIEVTVDDPKTYTAPWTVKLHQQLQLDMELIDYLCVENEKDVISGHLVGK
jgi:hypothetical protein